MFIKGVLPLIGLIALIASQANINPVPVGHSCAPYASARADIFAVCNAYGPEALERLAGTR